MIPLQSAKFQEYDWTSATVKACTVLRTVLEFLWASHQKLVPTTVAAVDPNQDTVEWTSLHHFACIMSAKILGPLPPFLAPPALGAIDSNVLLSAVVGDIRMICDVAQCQLL